MTDWLERARAEISKRADQSTINTIEGSLTTVTIVANQARSLEKTDDQGSNDCNDSGPFGQIQNFRAARSTALPTLAIDEIAERIGSWLKVTDNPPRNATGIWKDLAEETEDFALGVWTYPAVMTGWSESALFAIDEGLLPEKLRRGLHFMKIDSDAATLMTGKGELENFRRPRTAAPPWWRDPRVAVAAHNASAHAARKGN